MKKVKIGKKLFLSYSLILILSMTTSFVSIFQINKLWRNTKDLFEGPLVVSNKIRDVKINTLNIRRYLLDMSILKEEKEINELIALIDKEEDLAFKNLDTIRFLDNTDQLNVGKSIDLLRKYKPLREDVIRLIKDGKTQSSSDLMIHRNREFVNELFNQMQSLIDITSQRAESLYKSAEDTKANIIGFLIVLMAISVTMCMVLAYFITRSITLPLKRVVNNIGEISKGNLNNKKLYEGLDEIGQLAASFNKMQDNLLEKSVIAEQIAQGNFSAHVIPAGPNDAVALSINLIANNFNLVVKQAQKVAAGDFETEITGIAKTNPLATVLTQMLDSLREVVQKTRQVAAGDYSGEIMPKSKSDELALSLNQMTTALRKATEQNLRQNELKTAQNELNETMRGDLSLELLSKNIVTFLSKFVNAKIGALYLYNDELKAYQLTGSYAFVFRKGTNSSYKTGEGLVGQAALEKEIITFSELPDDYIRITSGIGDTVPKNVLIVPLVYNDNTIGVLELGFVNRIEDIAYDFLNMVKENIAISIASANSRTQMSKLLEITSKQAHELQVQQEELKQSNEELEAQTQALKKSEEYLQAQQEELRVTNEELEEKTKNLEKQKLQMEKQNHTLEAAWLELDTKAKELEITNKYKSEFLANMSHELRTPLNSLLILSQTLMENKNNNLSKEQVESATIIFKSGNDLLNLINDILDLSKIESGKMNISITQTSIGDITSSMQSYFGHIIREKGLNFEINVNEDVPEKIHTDEQRLNQVLRNIMSNAIKFTDKGSIKVNIYKPDLKENLSHSGLNPAEAIAFSICDTGIGIAKDKQAEIFEAFQQVDGSISRKYGGTGLGLSITRELTRVLGGEVKLVSEPGKGSEFIVFIPVNLEKQKETITKLTKLPIKITPPVLQKNESSKNNIVPVKSIPDNRDLISPNEPCILIIEDDLNFAKLLANICKEKGFLYLASATGEEGIQMAREYLPKGILLDINLPGINGWETLETLKSTTETRHIPVHVITAQNETLEAYNKGAIGFLTKPVTKDKLETAIDKMQAFISREIKDLLLIEDDENLRKSTKNLLESKDIRITECNLAGNAIKYISSQHFDCIVLDLGLPDMNGFEMLKKLKENNVKIPPIVVYTGKELTPEENEQLQFYTQNIIIKGVKSEERLLDETALFLHRVVSDLPERQKKMLVNFYDKNRMFEGKTILIVDDDMRNVFAITKVLETGKMKVLMAPNGQKAIETLEKHEEIDLILMDIMMPVMDGYEAMKTIRSNKKWSKLPILALTAKAMKEDREKSIAAGANDYLSKPLDVQKLFNMMRIWLYK
jgi:CheY-like chemotaxis protein/signal transduction histidine kinase/methyl-accepting chemotaxis protein